MNKIPIIAASIFALIIVFLIFYHPTEKAIESFGESVDYSQLSVIGQEVSSSTITIIYSDGDRKKPKTYEKKFKYNDYVRDPEEFKSAIMAALNRDIASIDIYTTSSEFDMSKGVISINNNVNYVGGE